MEQTRKFEKFFQTAALVTIVLTATVMMFGCGACTKKIYVSEEREVKETMVRDTLYRVRERTDTILVRDSIVYIERGDTVREEIWRWRERVRVCRDTVQQLRHDTIFVERRRNIETVKQSSSGSIKPWIIIVVVALIIIMAGCLIVKSRLTNIC